MFVYTGRVPGRVHGLSCTWQVGLPGRVHVPRRHATAVCGPFTAVYTAVYDGCYTAVRHVHTSTPQLKCRVRAMCASVYTASTQSCTWQVDLHGRLHGPRRHVTAVGRVHGRTVTRHVHGRVHVPYRAVYMFVYTGRVHGRVHGPHTVVACRLGSCTRPGRPTGRIHGPDDPCTRPCDGRVHGPLHGRVRAMKTAENGSVHDQCTRPTRYTAV